MSDQKHCSSVSTASTYTVTLTLSRDDAIAISSELAVLRHIQREKKNMQSIEYVERAYDAFERALNAAVVTTVKS